MFKMTALLGWIAGFGKNRLETPSDDLETPGALQLIDPKTDPILLKLMPPRAPIAPPYFPNPNGVIEAVGTTRLSGWVWDEKSPNTPQEVEVWALGVLITKTMADRFRKDLVDAGIGDGRHGLLVDLPEPVDPSLWKMGAAYCRVDAMRFRLPIQPKLRSLD